MSATTYCPHCGKEIEAGVAHCPHCGAVVQSASAAPQPGAAAANDPAPPPSSSQPWLRPDFVGEDDVPFEPEDDDLLEPTLDELAAADVPAAAGRLVSGVQGLLDPIRTTATLSEAEMLRSALAPAPLQDSSQMRVVRLFMGEEQPLAAPVVRLPGRSTSLWLPWIFLALLIAVGAASFLQFGRPTDKPLLWPGVEAGFDAVATLPPQSAVTILWAYDPATAGEMDLIATPIIQQLLARGARIDIVSLLPNGPATALRLIDTLLDAGTVPDAALPAPEVTYRFLPGGSAVLPALAQNKPALTVILAAQAADVQAWLELVAPWQQGVPVVAGVGAAADPILRPYLDSQQLAGLVSGFDGAYSYGYLTRYPQTAAAQQKQDTQINGQNVAGLVLLALLIAGNAVAWLAGRRGRG